MFENNKLFGVDSNTLLIMLLVGVLTAAACWTLLYGVLMLVVGHEARVQSRIRRFVTRDEGSVSEDQQRSQLRQALFARLDTRFADRSLFKKMRADIARADLHITVSELVLIEIVVSVTLALMLWALVPRFGLLLAAAGLVLGLLMARVYLKYLAKRRVSRFEDQLPDALTILATSVRGGFSLFQAIQLIAKEAPDPCKAEFNRVVQEISLGSPLQVALEGLMARIPTEDVEILGTAIILQSQTGGSLSHVLDVVAHTIRERHRVQREIRSLTAQQRYSASMLALLPFLLAGVLFLISPTYIGHLFQPGWVLCMPVGAVIMSIFGYYIMRRIASIDV